MGYTYPKYLTEWLDKEWRRPPQSFVNSSTYYSNLDVSFMTYMNTVVRPCMAFSTGSADSVYNSGIKLNVGQTVKDAAVRIIKGDKLILDGDDDVCRVISDKWFSKVNFESFLEAAIDYMCCGGTSMVKLNIARGGKIYPSATRVDRYYADIDEFGEVLHITIFNSFLFSQSFGRKSMRSYWLVEERFFKGGKPFVRYKVHFKSGVVGQEILPGIDAPGMAFDTLPSEVQQTLIRRGVVLDTDLPLPFRNLGVWLLRRTATNSCVPGLAMGDPLVYGALDILWAVDTLFSGSVTDVILGKGKILVPKKYLGSIREEFGKLGIKTRLGEFTDDMSDDDDTLVYIYTEHDKDFTPQSVQFEIRSEQYNGMLEMYLRQIVVHCGFAPTSVFPFLQDQSAKTATEVNAEENLTRATVLATHKRIIPVINEMLEEVLRYYGFVGTVRLQLTDYIGNKVTRDMNTRENYTAGLTSRERAVQDINNLSAAETQEEIAKIDAETSARDMFGGGYDTTGSGSVEQSGEELGRYGNGDTAFGAGGVLQENPAARDRQEGRQADSFGA